MSHVSYVIIPFIRKWFISPYMAFLHALLPSSCHVSLRTFRPTTWESFVEGLHSSSLRSPTWAHPYIFWKEEMKIKSKLLFWWSFIMTSYFFHQCPAYILTHLQNIYIVNDLIPFQTLLGFSYLSWRYNSQFFYSLDVDYLFHSFIFHDLFLCFLTHFLSRNFILEFLQFFSTTSYFIWGHIILISSSQCVTHAFLQKRK